MMQGVAALKLKVNLHFLSSLHSQSNQHIFWLQTQSIPHKIYMNDYPIGHVSPVQHLHPIQHLT